MTSCTNSFLVQLSQDEKQLERDIELRQQNFPMLSPRTRKVLTARELALLLQAPERRLARQNQFPAQLGAQSESFTPGGLGLARKDEDWISSANTARKSDTPNNSTHYRSSGDNPMDARSAAENVGIETAETVAVAPTTLTCVPHPIRAFHKHLSAESQLQSSCMLCVLDGLPRMRKACPHNITDDSISC